MAALANVPIVQSSTDPYTNSTSTHQTEVEPDTFAYGDTIVSAFQVGRAISSAGGGCVGLLMNVLWFLVAGLWICLSHLGLALASATRRVGRRSLAPLVCRAVS